MANEYIEKGDLLNTAKANEHALIGMASLYDIFCIVDDTQLADAVEVKHGYWILLDECANEGVYCSVCSKKVYRKDYANQNLKSNFCPNCGAKMDGERKG